jgi:uncharacterized protein
MIGKWHIQLMENTPMEEWQSSVLAERAQLEGRIERLIAFFSSGKAYKLSHDEYALLASQVTIMKVYLDILQKRIAYWEE